MAFIVKNSRRRFQARRERGSRRRHGWKRAVIPGEVHVGPRSTPNWRILKSLLENWRVRRNTRRVHPGGVQHATENGAEVVEIPPHEFGIGQREQRTMRACEMR